MGNPGTIPVRGKYKDPVVFPPQGRGQEPDTGAFQTIVIGQQDIHCH
jgi:hypothetical protein